MDLSSVAAERCAYPFFFRKYADVVFSAVRWHRMECVPRSKGCTEVLWAPVHPLIFWFGVRCGRHRESGAAMSDVSARAEDAGPDEVRGSGRRRPPLPLALIVVGAIGGALLGWSSRAPERTSVYLELFEQHESTGFDLEQALEKEVDHQDTNSGLREEVEQLERPFRELDEHEKGLDDREGELDDREEGLDERSEELDQREEGLDGREDEVTDMETQVEESNFPGTGTLPRQRRGLTRDLPLRGHLELLLGEAVRHRWFVGIDHRQQLRRRPSDRDHQRFGHGLRDERLR